MEQYWILVILTWTAVARAQTTTEPTTSNNSTTNSTEGYSIRLTNGETTDKYISGRLEVSQDNGTTWGTVCDDYFNKSAAVVACRGLGFTDGEAIAKAYYGPGNELDIFLDDVECQGWESGFRLCRTNVWKDHDCDHAEDVSVFCYNNTADAFKTRLVDKGELNELNTRWGRLEVAMGTMSWGTVCDDMFNQNAATIACREFDYNYGQTLTTSFDAGDRTYLDEVNCKGTESNLLECKHNSWRTHDCSQEEDQGLICFNTTVRLRSMKLSIRNVGTVEVWQGGEWMEVCQEGWDQNDAKVVCKELGYVDGFPMKNSAFGSSGFDDPFGRHPWSTSETYSARNNVACNGTETTLASCTKDISSGCGSRQKASVICYNTTIDQIDNTTIIRFADGGENYGRVEVRHLGVWGQLSIDHWTDNEASVVCRMKGFKGGKAFGQQSEGHLPSWLTTMRCIGNETSILDCNFGIWGEPTNLVSASHVLCYNDSITVSLENEEEGYGRVNIVYDGVSGTICNDMWTDTEAGVVCKMKGFTDGRAMKTGVTPGSGRVFMTDMVCGFPEKTSIFQCENNGWERTNDQCATHENDAGVRCYKNVQLNPGTHSTGVVQFYDNNAWNTMCGRAGFDNKAATVVCKELGFNAGLALPISVFGLQRSTAYRANLTCNGNEASILNCTYDADAMCLPTSVSYASVSCYQNATTVTNKYLLEGGTFEPEEGSGRVRVHAYETMGYICDKYWGDPDAKVLCKSLGYTGGIAYRYSSMFPGPYFISEINCAGNETRLEDCPSGQEVCTSQEAAGALCFGSQAPQLEFEINGLGHGRLRLVINNDAGRICGSKWDDPDAAVACTQLGYNDGKALLYPRGTGPAYMSRLQCFGNEANLFKCHNPGWRNSVGDEDCSQQDAGAFCFMDVRVTEGTVNTTMAMGKVSMLLEGRWHMVCADSFDQADADITCKSMGFTKAKILRTYRATYNPTYITQLGCAGSESTLTNCSHVIAQCPYTVGQARVICFSDTQTSEVRYTVQNEFNGRAMVERYGLNGTICEEGWDDNDAMVLCKQLGYRGGVALGTTRNSSFELVWYSQVNCTGDESSLDDCPRNDSISTTCRNSATSAGVLCYRSSGVQVRLADGGKNFGRVEIAYDGVWGTVCDYIWSRYDARALCRQLGYVEAIAYAHSRYGRGSGPVYLDAMRCRIDDQSIYSCPNRGWNNSANYCQQHENDAGVYCFPNLRMEPNETFGALEIWTGFAYGLICAEGFTDLEAKVACREMGYYDGRAIFGSAFGDLRKEITLRDVRCTGEEAEIKDCSYSSESSMCTNKEYISLVCTNVTDNSGAYVVSLDNGTYGRVVVRHLNHDGYICPDSFSNKDAKVICTEMGMTNGGIGYKRINPTRSRSIKDIRWMSKVNCSGNENLLELCPGADWYHVGVCNMTADAAALCYREPGIEAPTFRFEGGTRLEGRIEVKINGTWGSICGDSVDDNVASIICRQMNFQSGSAGMPGSKGKSTGPVWINHLQCTGNESSIFDCNLNGLGESDSRCETHLHDAVIMCHSTVRLAGNINGRTDYGRVEVNMNGTWKSVCDSGFNQNAAQVACRQMGYNHARRQCCSALGPDRIDLNISRVTCEGSENYLSNCTIDSNSECSSNNYVAVLCSSNVVNENLNIALPNNGFLGMVNISRYGVWGAICQEGWNDTEADAACRRLNYLGGVSIPGKPIQQGMPILAKVSCSSGQNFSQCSVDSIDADHGCSDERKAAAAICSNSAEGVQYRLAPGSGSDSGLAQVNFNGVWGYISRIDFDDEDAGVFCRSIGFVSGQVFWQSPNQDMEGSILASELDCSGGESLLHHCGAQWDPNQNKYIPVTFAVSVTCFRGVRIERGDEKTNGIIQVYENDNWGTVCSDHFSNNEANVLCRELGMSGGLALCCSPYGFNFDQSVVASLNCTGSETSFRNCRYDAGSVAESCYRQRYSSVACYNGTLSTNFSISLGESITLDSSYTGQVAIMYAGVEGRICSDNWDDKDANVVCKQLGFSRGIAYSHYRSSFSYFDYTGPYWTSEVNCTGNELTFQECPHIGFGNVKECESSHFGGVLCFNNEGLFYRMVGGGDQWGRVEVAVDGRWGTLCDRYWDRREAQVFCKSLGYDDGDPYYGDYNTTSDSIVYESNLRCSGKEKSLNKCPHEGWAISGIRSCVDHSRDAGVFCYTKVKLSTGVGQSVPHGGVLWNQQGTWYQVCDDGFTDMSARIVCESIGFIDGRSICCSAYGARDTGDEKLLTNMTLRCTGLETSISDCVVTETCESGLYASVVCSNNLDTLQNDNYTFTMNKNLQDSGTLTVSHFGVDGRICARDWNDADAAVACQAEGYPNGIAYQHSYVGTYATRSQLGPYWMSSINCTGEETDLTQCSYLHRSNMGNCTDKHTASILCFNQSGIDYRLQDGGDHFGRVEVYIGGVWGTICDSYWDSREANVFCRQLNFSDGDALSRAHYGEGDGPIWLSHVQCSGNETSFHQCPHRGYKDLYSSPVFGWPFLLPCTSHRDDASVFCYKSVRLNQRFGVKNGGLEVFDDDGKKYGVCDSGFTNTEATVACKSLGMNYTHGRVMGGSVFGNLSGPIRFQSISCNGDESDISECVKVKGNCASGSYASIYCANEPFSDTAFAIRLAADGLSENYHGIVEVRRNGVWGRICMQGWDNLDSGVACRNLGFKGGVAYLHIVKNTNAIITRNFSCTGRETLLEQCPRQDTADKENCSYDSNDAGVICYNGTGVNFRLFGGATNSTGRVELSYDNQWGTVCSWAWSTDNAGVFCRSLGQGFLDGVPERSLIPNLPRRDYLLNGAFCNGDEDSILTCLNSGFNTSLLAYLCSGEAYTTCYKSKIDLTRVRLMGSDKPDRGRVEVYVAGPDRWGTVCDDYWDATDAGVVCRMLGYQHGRAVNQSAYGEGTGSIWLDNVECLGNETSIKDCKNRGIGTHNCNHTEDASVECYNTTTTLPTVPSTVPTTTRVPTTTPKQTTTPTTTRTTTPTTTSPTTATTTATTTTTKHTPTVQSTKTPTTSKTSTGAPPPTTTTKAPTTTVPTTTTMSTTTTATEGVPPKKQTSSETVVLAVVIPIIILVLIVSIVAVVLWRKRRIDKGHIAHERFHDDIIEQTRDGSIAMQNQLYDMNVANGDTADPLHDMKYLAEDSEISIEGNGYAHFSKTPSAATEDDSGGFSNPLYSVMKDPTVPSEPAELKLDLDLKDSKT